MYYLNDQHKKYEYTVYVRHGTGIPFLAKTFSSYSDACLFLEEKAKRHLHYNQIFFIDDKFFENYYPKNMNGTYYKILRRPLSDWEEVEKEVA